MLFYFPRNRNEVFEIGDHPGVSEQGKVAHQLQHQVGPRLAGILWISLDEAVANGVQQLVAV